MTGEYHGPVDGQTQPDQNLAAAPGGQLETGTVNALRQLHDGQFSRETSEMLDTIISNAAASVDEAVLRLVGGTLIQEQLGLALENRQPGTVNSGAIMSTILENSGLNNLNLSDFNDPEMLRMALEKTQPPDARRTDTQPRPNKRLKSKHSTENGQFDASLPDLSEYPLNNGWEKYLEEDMTAQAESYSLYDPSNQANSFFNKLRPLPPLTAPPSVEPPARNAPPVTDPLIEGLSKEKEADFSELPLEELQKTITSVLDGQLESRREPTRSAWAGDGTGAKGSFNADEIQVLNDFMDNFCRQHKLDRQSLCERVWTTARQRDNFWDDVSAVLPHRSRASVYKHVKRTWHVFTVRGRWTEQEDKQLAELWEQKGPQWKQIGCVLRRMPEDCRDRWRNYVKCGGQRNQNKWSAEESALLQDVVTSMLVNCPGIPINWTEVSERMGGTRSRIQCRYKWKKLSQEEKDKP